MPRKTVSVTGRLSDPGPEVQFLIYGKPERGRTNPISFPPPAFVFDLEGQAALQSAEARIIDSLCVPKHVLAIDTTISSFMQAFETLNSRTKFATVAIDTLSSLFKPIKRLVKRGRPYRDSKGWRRHIRRQKELLRKVPGRKIPGETRSVEGRAIAKREARSRRIR